MLFSEMTIQLRTRSTGTVDTSAKLSLTSVTIWIRIRPELPQKFNHLFTLPNFPDNFTQIRSEVFAESC